MLPSVQLGSMVSNLEVLRLRAPVGYYLGIFVRGRLAFRWRLAFETPV